MTYTFTASFVKEGRWFVARAVELGVVSQGKTLDDAKKNLREAVALYLEDEPALAKQSVKERPMLAVLDAEI